MTDIHEVTEWYIPGPVDVRHDALEAMSAQPYGHRTDEIKPFIKSIRKNLFAVVGASEEEHSMVLTGGSGTNALEMAARSWARPTEDAPEVLITSIGYFGDLWGDIFESCSVPVHRMRVQEGEVIDEDKLADRLREHPYDIVTLTHNDTSTGTVNPLKDMAGVIKASGALLFVDGVSSAGGMPIDMSSTGIDFLATAPQKSLGTPPGLSLAVVRNDALEKVAHTNRGFTTDVVQQVEANKDNMTLTTPPEAQIGALALQLSYIVEVETPEQRYGRHTQMAEMARDWAEGEGFELLPSAPFASNTVSCFVNNRGVPLVELRQKLWDNRPMRYGFDSGHPKLARIRKQAGLPDTFRVPHMGDRRPEQLAKYLATLSLKLK